jgi:tetratricopeptide (TPR) repeat protein
MASRLTLFVGDAKMLFLLRTIFQVLAASAFLYAALWNPCSWGVLRADEPGQSKNPAVSSRDELIPEPPRKPSSSGTEPTPAPPLKPAIAQPGTQQGTSTPAEREIAILCQSAAARAQAGQVAEAEATYDKALAAARTLLGKDHLDCGVILARLGMLKYEAKQYDQSAARFAEALPIFRLHLPPDNPHVTFLVNEYARALSALNRDVEAARLNAENLKIREATLGRRDRATLLSLHNLGSNYAKLRRWADAVATLEEWLARDKDGQSAKVLNLPEALEYLGISHAWLRHDDRAEEYYIRTLGLLAAQPQPDYPGQVRVLERLIQVCGLEHEKGFDNAHKYGERCLKLCKEQFGPESPATINAMGVVGVAYYKVGDDNGGAKLLRDYLQLEKKIGAQDSDEYWAGVLHLAHVEFRLGRFNEGETLTWSALSAMGTRLGNHRNSSAWWESMADVLPEAAPHLARPDEMDRRLQQFVADVEKLAGADDPATATALAFVAGVYLRLESWETGRHYALRALSIERKTTVTNPLTLALTLHQLGLAAQKQDKYAEAETYLLESAQIRWRKIGREDVALAGCLCDLGYVYAKTGRYLEAEATLRKSLAIAEKFGAPTVAKDAHKNLEALHKDPKYAEASMSPAALAKAQSFLLKGEWDQAILFYDEAIRLAPQVAPTYFLRGYAYERNGRATEAFADYSEAIRRDPKRESGYTGRSRIYAASGDIANAIADLDQAILLDPNTSVHFWSRALLFKAKRDFPKAIADVTKAISLDPTNKGLPLLRGQMYRESGDFDKAIAEYDRLIAMDPENSDACLGRYAAYLKKGDKEKAIDDFDRAMEISAKRKNAQGSLPATTGSGH